MLDKPLDFAEQELLSLIRQIHAESGPIPRDRLTVVGRGRGLEVARPLGRLKSLGLVSEMEQRPSLWRWLFGARKQMVLIPLGLTAEAPAVAEPAPAFSETLAEPRAGALPEALPETVAEASVQPVISAPQAWDPCPECYAPVEEVIPATPEPQPQPAPDYGSEPAAPAEAPVAAPAAAPRAEVAPRPQMRPAPGAAGYTDDLGGQPEAFTAPPAIQALDPDLLEGLRDLLATLGMEMTLAGEGLVADRLARGATPGEALMQLVLFAFGHAARFDMESQNPSSSEDLREYADAVLTELTRLYEAGEIGAAQFEHDRQGILALADNTSDRSGLVAELFMDPVGGAAPPALLPEELRSIAEEDEEGEAGL